MSRIVVEVQKHGDGGWEWRLLDPDYKDRTYTAQGGWASYRDRRNALRGKTWTRRGAHREAQRAARRLRRYLDRPEPERIEFPPPTPERG